MKKTHLFLTAFLMLLPLALFANNTYVIRGTVPNDVQDSATVTLTEKSYRKDSRSGSFTLAKTITKNGRFAFEGKVDEPVMAAVTVAGMMVDLILEPGEITIDFQSKFDATVSGTPINDEFFQKVTSLFFQTTREMTSLDKKKDEEVRTKIWTKEKEREYKKSQDKTPMSQWHKNRKDFMKKYADYPGIVSNYIVSTYIVDSVVANKYLSKMPDNYAINMQPKIEAEIKRTEDIWREFEAGPAQPLPENVPENVSVGKRFTDIIGKNPQGNDIRLSELLAGHKLTILDFWASWCGPCLKEMPFMNTIQEEFGNKGVQIVGISSDISESAWKTAMEKHKMPWSHMLSKEAGTTYYVLTIPYTIIIDENGIIVARNLRGVHLKNKIIELLGR